MSEQEANLESLVRKVISLPSIERKVVHLRIFEAMAYDEIAYVTGISERSIRQILETVVRKIREPGKRRGA